MLINVTQNYSDRANAVLANNPCLHPNASILHPTRDFDRTTDRYVKMDDLGVVEEFNRRGFYITQYKQTNVRLGSSSKEGTQRYMAVYSNENYPGTVEGRPQIIQKGAHDGTTKLSILMGFFRFICSNGLVVGDRLFDPVSIKHIGDNQLMLSEVVEKLGEACPRVFGKIDAMQRREMLPEEIVAFGKAGIELRFGTPDKVELQSILEPRRVQDEGFSLWRVFNRVQENLMLPSGDTRMKLPSGRLKKASPLKNIDASLRLNQGLWTLAEGYLN